MSYPPNPRQDDDDAHSLQLVDPNTGKPVKIADMRAEFERSSKQTPRDPTERAFIESKIEMIRGDRHLSANRRKTQLQSWNAAPRRVEIRAVRLR